MHQRGLFAGTVFLASFLLFLVEPIAAKQLLPTLGGSAAVWITCLVFFQTALLLAYLYAHWLARRSLTLPHLALLALASVSALLWSLHPVELKSPESHPIPSIFLALGLSIGLPFLVLGATSPLLQVGLARIEKQGIPYRLFALSNLASLLALAAYPTVIEPHLTLKAQRLAWSLGFLLLAVAAAILAWRSRAPHLRTEPTQTAEETSLPAPAFRQKLLWVLLPAGAAMQLSSVTGYLTQNIAAIPLLWVLPLAIYLVTLILAFQFPRLLPRGIVTRFMVVMLAGLGYMLSKVDVSIPLAAALAFFLVEVFVACLFCHTEAVVLRPQRTRDATLFYLWFAAGGALGSFLIGIVSPLIFSFNYDLALTFLVTALLALAVTWSSGWPQRLLWGTACGLLLALAVMLHLAYRRDALFAARNFYGSLRVRQSLAKFPGASVRTLTNGTIQHGTQIFSGALRKTPTTYYAADSGIGLALRHCCAGRPRHIGVVGLGVGTIAAYGQPGDRIRFYEINPAVTPIAQSMFSYLRESPAQVTIAQGDARTLLAREQPQAFDVLAIDAFSGDAIPLHLLTRQAVEIYKRHLAPGGILAFHISNQHVDLEPEIALLAQSAGMQARGISSFQNDKLGEFTATWVLMTADAGFFKQLEIADHARPVSIDPHVKLWTDDYSSLLPLLHW